MPTPGNSKQRVETGIRADRYGFEVYITCAQRRVSKRFPPSTPRRVMRQWRRYVQAELEYWRVTVLLEQARQRARRENSAPNSGRRRNA